MKSHERLIDALAADLKPTARQPGLDRLALTWVACSLVYVALITGMLGPFRPGFSEQLLGYPRFALDMLLGVAAIGVTGVLLFRSAVPGAVAQSLRWLALSMVGAWLAMQLFGLVSPALEPGMLGKRPHCMFETLLIALPPMGVALVLQRRMYPLSPARSAMAAGLCAGLMPAWIMQIACMYDPQHILSFHILPGLAVAVIGLLVGWMLPRRGSD